MSTWRRKAIELFPELERDLRRSRTFTTYDLFSNLRVLAERAHKAEDDDFLRKVYDFAEWASRQKNATLWNSAGVAFYEHIVENPDTVDRVLPWLSGYVIRRHWDLWAISVGPQWPQLLPKFQERLRATDDPGEAVNWAW